MIVFPTIDRGSRSCHLSPTTLCIGLMGLNIPPMGQAHLIPRFTKRLIRPRRIQVDIRRSLCDVPVPGSHCILSRPPCSKLLSADPFAYPCDFVACDFRPCVNALARLLPINAVSSTYRGSSS